VKKSICSAAAALLLAALGFSKVGGSGQVDGLAVAGATRKQAFAGGGGAEVARFDSLWSDLVAELAEVLQEGAPWCFAFALGFPYQELPLLQR